MNNQSRKFRNTLLALAYGSNLPLKSLSKEERIEFKYWANAHITNLINMKNNKSTASTLT